jgi:PPOX class probable FMN-dependent enzyme
MPDNDPYKITDLSQIREQVGEPMEQLELKILDHIDDFAADFIKECPFLVLATVDAEGNLDASPKGDSAGFVEISGEREILIPDRPGNKLVYGHRNILQNPHVAVLFIRPGTNETLRVNGTAELTRDPAVLERLAARGKSAPLAIRVTVDECFFHCAKAFIRSDLWKPDKWLEPKKISFGRMMAPKIDRTGETDELATAIDLMVEDDARDNL